MSQKEHQIQNCTVMSSTILYSTVQYCTVQCNTVLYCKYEIFYLIKINFQGFFHNIAFLYLSWENGKIAHYRNNFIQLYPCYSQVLAQLYLVIPSYTQLYLVIPSYTQLYPVMLSYTQLYPVRPSYTLLYLIIPD